MIVDFDSGCAPIWGFLSDGAVLDRPGCWCLIVFFVEIDLCQFRDIWNFCGVRRCHVCFADIKMVGELSAKLVDDKGTIW